MSFGDAVYRVVRRIPPGRVATYGQIAALLDRPRAARAVGGAMRSCPAGLPWYRVVNAAGGISRRPRPAGMLTQRIRLAQEGVAFRRGRVVLARHRWRSGTLRRVPGESEGALPPRRGEGGAGCSWR